MSTDTTLQQIRSFAPDARPRIAVLLGSGWAGVGERVVDPIGISYAALDGFGASGVGGHAGELRLGRLGMHEVAVMCGRRHAYETGRADAMKHPLRVLRALGCEVLIQTNAAGSLDPAMGPGSLMLLRDHLNVSQQSPLFGEPGDDRFVDMSQAYDPALRRAALQLALQRGQTLHEGVYVWFMGPQFETPAEIRMFRGLGADAVGMSTVPETIVARHAGMRVLALSLITNMAAGLSSEALSHAHTLEQARVAGAAASEFLVELIGGLALVE